MPVAVTLDAGDEAVGACAEDAIDGTETVGVGALTVRCGGALNVVAAGAVAVPEVGEEEGMGVEVEMRVGD